MGQDERQNIDRGIADLKESLKGDDVDKINKAKDDLLKASHKLAEEIYKSEQAKGQGGPQAGEQSAPSGDGNKKDDVVEAEVVEEKK